MTKLILLVFVITCVSAVRSAQGQAYSLEDCIRVALGANQELLNSRLDVQATTFRIKEVKSAMLPTIDIMGQSLYYKDLPSQYAPASAFGGPEGEYTKMTLNMKQTTSATVQVTQNLYNHAVITGVRVAKVAGELASIQEQVVREDLTYNVAATFYSVQVLNDNLARLRQNIVNLQKTIDVNRVLKDNDLVSDNVHHRMQINLENLQNQYENQHLLADKNLTLLKYLMNIPVDQHVSIDSFDYAETFAVLQDNDISQRPDIRLQQTQVKLSQLEKKSIAAGYYPALTNKFSYGYTAYYDQFGPGKQINNDWIRSSYFTLTLKIPVFDGFQKQSQIRQKDIVMQKNINTLNMMRANAEKELQDATQNYGANRNLLVSNKKSLDLAEQLFNSAQGEYEQGITSVTEFLNAQNDLSNARTNYSTALLNLKLAELSLRKANGTLLNN